MAGKKITGRTKQLSLKSTPEFHTKLKELAEIKKCLMIEILEEAVGVWEKQTKKKTDKLIDKKKVNKAKIKVVPPSKNSKRPLIDDDNEEPNTNSKKRKIED